MSNKKNDICSNLIKYSQRAKNTNSVPIASAIVNENGEIVAIANNKSNKYKISTHAEILAINKAMRKLRTNKLVNCSIWTTMEPCMMCTGAIINSGIKRVYFYLNNDKSGFLESNHTYDLTKISINKINDNNEELVNLLKDFFVKLR